MYEQEMNTMYNYLQIDNTRQIKSRQGKNILHGTFEVKVKVV